MSGSDPARVLTDLLHAIDTLDWPRVRSCFSDAVAVDYHELFGLPAETLRADTLVERWRALLPGFDATQHLTGAVLTREKDGHTVVDTHVRGYHHIRGLGVWMVAGHYRARVVQEGERWQIAALTLQVFYEEGDRAMLEQAQARAAATPRAPRS